MQTNAAHRSALAIVVLLPVFGASVLGLVFAQTKTAQSIRSGSEQASGPALQLVDVCASDVDPKQHECSGWQNCHFCHRGGRDGTPEEKEQLDILVGLNESTIWLEQDKHAIAAKVLVPDRRERNLAYYMQKALGDERYDQLLTSNCHACHEAGEPETANAEATPGEEFALDHKFGVTCEACHGPAKDWVHDHWEERRTWRYKSPAEKEQAGFVNLRDPVTKARKCLSCHLGNVQEGKMITHEIYAAGHPPLPGFDVATFSLAMPRHWIPLSARNGEKFAKYKEVHGAGQIYAPNTREVLLGGLAALQSNLQLLSDYAALPEAVVAASSRPNDSGWPEFALYDCFACHHDLQAQSLRLRSRGASKVGRPPLRTWPNVVADLALRQTEARPELQTALTDVSDALAEQPFAERDRLRQATGAAARLVCEEIQRLEDRLDRSKLPDSDLAKSRERELVEQVLNQICELGSNQLHDYDSARQLVWASERVYEDYKKLNPVSMHHIAVQQALTQLKAANLKLELVRGQKPAGEPATLAAFLAARSSYDPQKFADGFRRLRDAVRLSIERSGGF